MKIILLFVLLLGLLLGYGYWHQANHGYLYLSLYQDESLITLTGVELLLLDAAGKPLAEGRTDDKFGVTHLKHPGLGYCSEKEQRAAYSKQSRQDWQDCFKAQSQWLMEWIEAFRFLSISIADCQLDRIPVSVRKSHNDWWLWWVPHPHIGGKPHTGYGVSLIIDPLACTATELAY